jgi:hypothetical protein
MPIEVQSRAATATVDALIFELPVNSRILGLTAQANVPYANIEFKLVDRLWRQLNPQSNIGFVDTTQVELQQVVWVGSKKNYSYYVAAEFGHVNVGSIIRATLLWTQLLPKEEVSTPEWGILAQNTHFVGQTIAGRLAVQTIAATAGDVETDLTPPASRKWIISSGKINLTNGAGVANRYIRLFKLAVATVSEELFQNTTAITASQTGTLSFGELRLLSGVDITNTNAGNLTAYAGIEPIVLEATETLRIGILGGVAADSYNGRIVLREIDEG